MLLQLRFRIERILLLSLFLNVKRLCLLDWQLYSIFQIEVFSNEVAGVTGAFFNPGP